MKLDSVDGAVLDDLSAPRPLTGLANDGTNLIGIGDTDFEVIFINPANGSVFDQIFFFDISNFNRFEQGFEGLAFDRSREEIFPVRGDTVFRFEDSGRLTGEFDVVTGGAAGFNNIRGSAFDGSLLYLADSATRTIPSGLNPIPTPVISTDPLGMAIDPTTGNLFVAIDAIPVDLVMELDPTTPQAPLLNNFETFGREVDGLAFHDGLVYVVFNDVQSIEVDDPIFGFRIEQRVMPIIVAHDPSTGDEVDGFAISVQVDFGGGEPFDGCGPANGALTPGLDCRVLLQDPISALASDGQFLYAGVKGTAGLESAWFRIDPTNRPPLFDFPAAAGTQITEFEGQLPLMPGFEAFEIIIGAEFPGDRELVASGDVENPKPRSDGKGRYHRTIRQGPGHHVPGDTQLGG